MQTFTDHLFTTSTFNKPLVIKDKDAILTLEENIEEQINRFLPYFTQVDVNISLQENKILLIELDLDDSIYTLKANISKNNEVTLTELYNG